MLLKFSGRFTLKQARDMLDIPINEAVSAVNDGLASQRLTKINNDYEVIK